MLTRIQHRDSRRWTMQFFQYFFVRIYLICHWDCFFFFIIFHNNFLSYFQIPNLLLKKSGGKIATFLGLDMLKRNFNCIWHFFSGLSSKVETWYMQFINTNWCAKFQLISYNGMLIRFFLVFGIFKLLKLESPKSNHF